MLDVRSVILSLPIFTDGRVNALQKTMRYCFNCDNEAVPSLSLISSHKQRHFF